MDDKKVWVYIGKGAFINGVPARDLLESDLARLSIDDLAAVENSKLYRRAPQAKREEEAPLPKDEGEGGGPESALVEKAEETAPKKGDKKE